MQTMRIAEVASRSGVPATTLRYYERIGLLVAGRSENGYRHYSERDLERLAFITRAKQLDITLEDLAELVQIWDSEDCSTVAHRLAQAVASRQGETQARIGDLVQLADQLQTAATRLAGTPSAGRCAPGCPCVGGDLQASIAKPTGQLDAVAEPAIVCTLGAADLPGRVQQWQNVLALARSRTAIEGGTALAFDPEPAITAELARLASVEQSCCSFFTFTLQLDTSGLRFEVRAPAAVAGLVEELFGATSRVAVREPATTIVPLALERVDASTSCSCC